MIKKVRAKYNLESLRQLAKDRGWACFAESYGGIHRTESWLCDKGHPVRNSFGNLLHRNQGCHDCQKYKYGAYSKSSLREMQELARERGGWCLSTEYVNTMTPLLWQCHERHEPWFAIPDSIKRGSWCPKCPLSLGESICRRFLEDLFSAKFESSRPKWLMSPRSGRPLELDGYNDRLAIAFEHQGEQHYKWCKRFHETREEFKNLKWNDALKSKLCAERGVRLIIIPHVPKLLQIDDLRGHLSSEFDRLKIAHPPLLGELPMPKIRGGKIESQREIYRLVSFRSMRGGYAQRALRGTANAALKNMRSICVKPWHGGSIEQPPAHQ